MEDQGADTGKEQGCLDGQRHTVVVAHQNGYQNGGAKHGKHVLQAQNEHLGQAEGSGIINGFRTQYVFLFGHVISSPFQRKGHFRLSRKCREISDNHSNEVSYPIPPFSLSYSKRRVVFKSVLKINKCFVVISETAKNLLLFRFWSGILYLL